MRTPVSGAVDGLDTCRGSGQPESDSIDGLAVNEPGLKFTTQ